MARWLYTLFYNLITPLIVLRLIYRGGKAPAYRKRIAERFGFFKAPDVDSCLWLHSVSVGETIAAAPVVKALQQQYPHKTIVITTMTPTGSERVKALFGDNGPKNKVFHVYAPYDLPGSLKRFLNRLKPELLMIMETELWPNTVHACASRDIPVVLMNARLSEKSAQGYQRFAALAGPMLNEMSLIAAQTQADAERFSRLGLSAEKSEVTGSIKFDITIAETLGQQAAALKEEWSLRGERLVWIAASTHDGEDEIILEAFRSTQQQLAKQQGPALLLVLVPRHPERFSAVAELCKQKGFHSKRRSSGEQPGSDVEVLVGDSMGEMMLFLGASDIAFVGGSLIPSGGHNMLEPAAWGLPIITGESDFNFLEISRLLGEAGGLSKAGNAEALASVLLPIVVDAKQRQQQGQAALKVVEANRGSLDRLLQLLIKVVGGSH